MGAELLKRYFDSGITEALRADRTFMQFAMNDDALVNNNTVELAHAGADPTVEINRNTFPATPGQRTDTPTQYTLEELSTDPTFIQYSEEVLVAYAKNQSVMQGHINALRDKMANRLLYKWAAGLTAGTSRRLTTGGSSSATRTSSAPTSTQEVYKLSEADILAAKNILDEQDVPVEGRKFLIPASFLKDILEIDKFVDADKYGNNGNVASGFVGRVFGMEVYMRSQVNRYASAANATGAIKDTEAAAAVTDVAGALIWHPQMVRRATGSINSFVELDSPIYYGDIMSALARFGGIRARNDNRGIVEIVEDAAAGA
jgi:N4-gp56 family major capsid protein